MLTNRELMVLVKECEKDLQNLNIKLPNATYEISNRMTKSLGICYFKPEGITIRINSLLTTPMAKNTLMHEMLHAIAGSECGHGYEWARLAGIVSRIYPDIYQIHMYADGEEEKQLNSILSEKFQKEGKGGKTTCMKCGVETVVTNRNGVLKNPSNYRCKCGGSLKVEKY